MNTFALKSCGSAVALGLAALSAPVLAQDAAPVADAGAEEIVVTGLVRAANRLDSSISVSALNAAAITEAAPRSAAELFRSLPGIRSESSGGEGNANIQMRGIPISTGGAKFLQIHEDGLPVLEFGDIQFGNADIFTRIDSSIARVEAVRGGSASTFASNSPGGIINLISRTGEREGGAAQASVGVDFEEYRLDANYGGRLAENLTFHVGGFYRVGEGPRRAGYDGNKGGQIRGNIIRRFDGGFLRINFKYLDDRAIAYMPSAVQVSGTNANPVWGALPGFRPQNDAVQSAYFTRAVTLGGANNRDVADIRDGMHPVVKALGFEFENEFAPGWTVNNKFRHADISGRFIAPFTATADTVQNLAATIGGAGSTAFYANGPSAGQAVAPGATALGIVLFNTKINAFDNTTNDLRLSRSAALGGGKLDLAAGFYRSRQTIAMDWLWSSYLLEAKGDNAALIDVRDAGGLLQSDGGLVAYGASFFDNCCRRAYNLDFDTNAPYAQLNWTGGGLTVDGSLRHDAGQVRGFVAGDGPVGSFDVDGNGAISAPETRVTTMPLTAQRPLNYDYSYWSYSFGAHYRLAAGLSAFARYSRGGRANADRYVFSGNTSPATGALLPGARPVDFVRQAEVGLKYQAPALQLYATGFWARTQEQNYELTSQRSTAKTYRAYGLELEGNYRSGGFAVAASGTFTAAKILASSVAVEVGKRPRRQAGFTYRLSPSYDAGWFALGSSLIGTTSSFAQDSNQLKLPTYAVVNAFATVRPVERVAVSLNANNLFDVAGYTEAEEGAIPASGIVRARSINGRTLLASVRYDF